MKQRRTRQLDATREVLAAATDHPSAEEILRRVRERLPRVSLGTIYRNLEKLRGQGEIQSLRVGEGGARYDGTVDAHDHFACDSCGRVIDLERIENLVDSARLERQGFRVRSQATTVYGLCTECADGQGHQAGRRSSLLSVTR